MDQMLAICGKLTMQEFPSVGGLHKNSHSVGFKPYAIFFRKITTKPFLIELAIYYVQNCRYHN
jgi:hypothetical protein